MAQARCRGAVCEQFRPDRRLRGFRGESRGSIRILVSLFRSVKQAMGTLSVVFVPIHFPLSSTQIPTFSSLFKFDFHMPILKAYKAEKVSTETLAQKAVEVCREMLGIICDRTNRDGEDDCGNGLVHSDS